MMPSSVQRTSGLGLWSGIGLVASSMIGVGVLVSAGWASSVLGPGEILLAWLVGGVIAMAGARAYAGLAEIIPRSGGEYRFLSDLLHPAVGYMAGWTSLVLGFSAPVAFSAAMADSYAATFSSLPGHSVGIAIICGATLLGVVSTRASQRTQDVLAFAKIVLLAGFVLVGMIYGAKDWPTWQPEKVHTGFPLSDFLGQLLWVAVAYSGWNTAVYAAEEFKDPRRTVPRAMVLGTLMVMILYLVVNWVFVANLTQGELASWRGAGGDGSKITLGHLIVKDLVGPLGATVMSAFVVLSMISSTSAMTVAGPRVYAAMARDGFLPRAFVGEPGKPPVWSTLLQGALALVLLLTHSFDLLVENVGAVLTFSTALTALALLRARWLPPKGLSPDPIGGMAVACALLYFVASAYTLWAAAEQRPMRLLWIALVVVGSGIGYTATRLFRRAEPAP
jgi:APA family basic amino acid/polyamine antiporter